METKTHHVQSQFKDKFAASYNFISFNCIVNGTTGISGGIMLLWDPCAIDINNMEFNYIDVSVTNLSSNVHWRATGVYGYPKHHEKHITCDLLSNLNNNHNSNNWLIFGDFNIVLTSNEKQGGNPIDSNLSILFKDSINSCGLQDLGYKGDIFTWNNRQQDNHFIKARLDRFLATNDWINLFPNFFNTHLLRYKSDHNPILLDFSNVVYSMQNHHQRKIIRYEQVWARDENHRNIVKDVWSTNRGTTTQKLNKTLSSLHHWGSNRFGIIPKRIKTT
jgi:hypothetical protein